MALDLFILSNIPNDYSLSNIKENTKITILNSDIQFDQFGKLLLTSGKQKTIQNVSKILLSDAEHPEDSLLSSPLYKYIGSKMDVINQNDLVSDVIDSFNRYNEYNNDNDDPNEYLSYIDDISYINMGDPRAYMLKISLELESGEKIGSFLGINI